MTRQAKITPGAQVVVSKTVSSKKNQYSLRNG